MKFKVAFGISLLFFAAKMAFCLLGLFNPELIASRVVGAAGVKSIMHSASVTSQMSGYVYNVVAVIGISSLLAMAGIWLMKRRKSAGFVLYALVNVLLGAAAMYAGYNMFGGLEFLAVLPLLGILMYVWSLDHFMLKKQ
ncbi:MAG: hypothetical protein IBJ09_12805 [Bacteroidia bacterium]|nr:hypothetical protein [Bacteroidia bacterium]